MKQIWGAAFAIAGMIQGPAATASPPDARLRDGRPTVVIDASRIDLSSLHGRRELRRRVARAVEAVCGSYFAATPDESDRIALCRRNAYADLSPGVAAIVARRGEARYDITVRS